MCPIIVSFIVYIFGTENYSGISCLSPVQKALVCLGRDWLGFRVGWEHDRVSLGFRTSNMRSASDHTDVVDAYLSSELVARRLAGPFTSPLVPLLHVSPFRVIPKNHQPGKWRLILGLPRSVPSPLFLYVTGAPLSPCIVNAWLHFILKAVVVATDAATSVTLAGILYHVILGRWSSDCRVKRNGEGLADV